MYVHLLIASDFKGQTKRKSVKTILDWAQRVVWMPPDLDAVLDFGSAAPARATRCTSRINFGSSSTLPAPGRAHPPPTEPTGWAMPGLSSPSSGLSRSTRPISSGTRPPPSRLSRHVRVHDRSELFADIADVFRSYITPGTDDIDRQLLQIREHFTSERGPGFEFWMPHVVHSGTPSQHQLVRLTSTSSCLRRRLGVRGWSEARKRRRRQSDRKVAS